MTFEIKTKSAFAELSYADKEQVLTFVRDAIADEKLVSIQGDVTHDGDDVYLYGLYANDDEWVSNYHSTGGMWEYSNPAKLLKEFTEITVNDVIEKLKAGNYIQPVEVKFPTIPTGVEEVYELNDGDISFNYYIHDNPNFSNVDSFVKYNGNWYLLPYYDNTLDMICMFCMEQFANRATDNSFYVPFKNPRNFGLSKRLSYEEW